MYIFYGCTWWKIYSNCEAVKCELHKANHILRFDENFVMEQQFYYINKIIKTSNTRAIQFLIFKNFFGKEKVEA